MQLCLDLMSVCDALLVASELSTGVRQEIDLAKKCNMEIIYLESEDNDK